jgi:hypothetical protein
VIRATAFAFVATIFLFARHAVAEDGRASSLVRVYVAGPPEAVLRTRATMRELLARIQVDVVVEAAPDDTVLAGTAPDGVARAFLDFRSLSAPQVALLQSGPDHDVVRRTLPASSSLEVSIEEAAHILYAAVEASRDASVNPAATGVVNESSGARESPTNSPPPGDAHGPSGDTESVSNEPTQAPARSAASPLKEEHHLRPPAQGETDHPAASAEDHAPTKATEARASALAFDAAASVFGGVSSFASDAVLPGVGGAVDVCFGRASLRPGAMFSFGMFFPSTVSRQGMSGSLRAESLRLLGLAEWAPWKRLGFAFGAGGGVDHVTFDPGASSSMVVSDGAASRYDPVLQGLVDARFRLSGAFAVFALAAADIDLKPHHYDIDTGGQTPTTFFSLPRVRPTALAGLTYVFHEGRAPSKVEASR